ncbi:MAG: hypothetical protein HY903_00920 [Deltaproteobacteria bacterium]|nr:hypothetical protein [Deltaproteobacteria bacterium]
MSARHQLSGRAATLLFPALFVAGGCGGASRPVDVAVDSEDGSEVASSVVKPASLALLAERDVTPAGDIGFRPDVTAINGELWLAYNSGQGGPQLQRYDTEMHSVGAPTALAPATEMITDLRVGNADGALWMAYESVVLPEIACHEHFLNAAAYGGVPPQVVASANHIATGCAVKREFLEHPTGVPANPEVADDPTPFYHRGARYVLTRAWNTSTVHHLRRLDDDLSVAEDILLDTGALVPGRQLSQSALLHIDAEPFLVAGFPSGMWVAPNTSELYILPLANDLRSFAGPAVRLPVSGRTFPTRVTRARHVNGTLIINFVDAFVGAAGFAVSEHLALFDVEAGFTLLHQEQVQDHGVMDNHSSFEIVDDRLYLFQQQDQQRLSAKVFRLEP